MAGYRNRLSEEECLSTRRLNVQRKKLRCLGCGRTMVTDRCHRFCGLCMRRNRRSQFYDLKMARVVHTSAATELAG